MDLPAYYSHGDYTWYTGAIQGEYRGNTGGIQGVYRGITGGLQGDSYAVTRCLGDARGVAGGRDGWA
jgi:hypothetical protein